MYDCLTAQEEARLFLADMDALEKEGELTTYSNTGKVFTEGQVKNNDYNDVTFFIAGRGGETNFHHGNKLFRERVLNHTLTYIKAGSKGRGKRFSRSLIKDHAITRGICFVVRQAYFAKNVKAGNISAQRKNSVLAEHAPRTLEDIVDMDEESTQYLTIGQDWVIGIITDMLRTAAGKYTCSSVATEKQNNTSTKRARPSPDISFTAILPDNEGCSVTSAISDDDDDESSLHSESTSSAKSASNDMFLSFSDEMPPCKKAKMMTPTTTTVEEVPAHTADLERSSSQCLMDILTAPLLDRQTSSLWHLPSISFINNDEAGERIEIWNRQCHWAFAL